LYCKEGEFFSCTHVHQLALHFWHKWVCAKCNMPFPSLSFHWQVHKMQIRR
jgi:hypothetical protein